MNITKRTAIATLALILCVSLFASCGGTAWAYRHNGQEFPAGAYIFAQLMAASDAIEIIVNENSENDDFTMPMTIDDVLTHTVENQSAADWINGQAHRAAMLFYAVDVWSQRYGLELDETMQGMANSFTDQIWGQARSLFEENGISRASIALVNTSDARLFNLFETLHGEGGEREIAEADLQDFFAAEYLYVDLFVISFPLHSMDGTILDDEDLEDEARAIMAGFVPRLSRGDSFEEVIFDLEIALEELRGADPGHSFARVEAEGTFSMFIEPQEIPFYPQEFIGTLQNLPVGGAQFIEENDLLILFQRRDILQNDSLFDMFRAQLMQGLMFDDFRDELVAYAEQSLQIEQNARAASRYRPANLQLN